LFSVSHVGANLGIFLRHGWTVVGPLFIPGLIIGLFASRPEPRSRPLLIFGAVTLPYLLYLPFDHWETLRFLLPGLVPLTIVAADGLMHIARLPRKPAVTAAVTIAFIAIVAGRSEILLGKSSVWEIASLEERYPLAGEWINVNTPQTSVVMANQHSGSLRWYGKRQTIRWDFIPPEQLAATVRDLQSHGATVYVALEGDEVAMFDQRFAGVIDQLRSIHIGRVRNVSFLRLVYLPPYNVIQRQGSSSASRPPGRRFVRENSGEWFCAARCNPDPAASRRGTRTGLGPCAGRTRSLPRCRPADSASGFLHQPRDEASAASAR
jgi:hypothetical protein